MIIPIFNLILGTISSAVAFILYSNYRESKQKSVWSLSVVFFLIAIYALCLAIPFILFPGRSFILGLSYNIAITCLFCIFLMGLRLPIFSVFSFLRGEGLIWLECILTFVGATVISLQMFDFQNPVLTNGFIFWRMHPIAAWLTGGLSLLYGIIWGLGFYRSSTMVKKTKQKIKLLTFAGNGLTLGASGLVFFTAHNNTQTLIATGLAVISCLATMIVLIAIPKPKPGRPRKS